MTDVAENEQQGVESTDAHTWDELLELKKKLAEDIVHKLQENDSGILSMVLEWSMVDYLVNEDTISDTLHDELLLWGLWEAAWIITPALKKYREMISKANSKTELESLKLTIFDEISQSGSSTSETLSAWQSSSSEAAQAAASWGVASWTALTSSKTTEKARVSSGRSFEIDHFDITASAESKRIWESLKWKEKPDLEPFACAMKAYKAEKAAWHIKNTKYVTVIDFTKNQLTQNRFFVINLDTKTVEYAEKCGHGEWSWGREWTTSFSNKSWSHQSSLWAFTTANHSTSNNKGTWEWNFWTPLEKSNSNLRSRGCAIHPVGSLVYKSWKPTSEWCFTIPRSQEYVNGILHKIEWWSLVFAYAKEKDYFAQSDYFQQRSDGSVAA